MFDKKPQAVQVKCGSCRKKFLPEAIKVMTTIRGFMVYACPNCHTVFNVQSNSVIAK